MSTVTRREVSETSVMEPTLAGSYVETVLEQTHLWRCDGCGLVWEKRWHAQSCEERGHARSFDQGPYGVRYVENGRPVGNLRWYRRSAVRRERVGVAA